jgi:hypothetical protein
MLGDHPINVVLTQAGWRVDDLAKELAELRSRGVEIQEYDMPGLKTVDGVADWASCS